MLRRGCNDLINDPVNQITPAISAESVRQLNPGSRVLTKQPQYPPLHLNHALRVGHFIHQSVGTAFVPCAHRGNTYFHVK